MKGMTYCPLSASQLREAFFARRGPWCCSEGGWYLSAQEKEEDEKGKYKYRYRERQASKVSVGNGHF